VVDTEDTALAITVCEVVTAVLAVAVAVHKQELMVVLQSAHKVAQVVTNLAQLAVEVVVLALLGLLQGQVALE